MAVADTIIGDLNAHGRGKGGALKEWMEAEDMMDIGTEPFTHVWGRHKCILDRLLTRGGGQPRKLENAWNPKSDHCIVGLTAEDKARQATRKHFLFLF